MVIAAEKGAAGGDPALLLERSRAITLQGLDRKGRAVVRVVGSYFPARALGGRAEEALRGYLRERVLPAIGDREFVVVYMHSRVDRGGNFPGVEAIRGAYESLPAAAKDRLRAVYFRAPGAPVQALPRHLRPLPLQLRAVREAEVHEQARVRVGAHGQGAAGGAGLRARARRGAGAPPAHGLRHRRHGEPLRVRVRRRVHGHLGVPALAPLRLLAASEQYGYLASMFL